MTTTRAPQQDRSRATRQRLLEAALESLTEVGWTHSTIAVIAERAGVSRGAAQHHFPTRESMITATVEYITEVRDADIRAQLAALPPGPPRTEVAVDMIVGWYTGTPFRAALELWVAASAEPSLRELVVPLEVTTGRQAHRAAVDLLCADESRPGVRELIQATLDLARGLGLANLLSDDSRRRRRILAEWSKVLDAALHPAG